MERQAGNLYSTPRLSDFWGRPMYLEALVLLPEGFETHPDARYPLAVYHGHFPYAMGGWRETPPDTMAPCEYSDRFSLDCHNRIQDQAAYQLFQDWTAPGFPRVLAVETAHPTPYYDDSYAVNSQANGPYAGAIMQELLPEIERRSRGIGQGWARFTLSPARDERRHERQYQAYQRDAAQESEQEMVVHTPSQ